MEKNTTNSPQWEGIKKHIEATREAIAKVSEAVGAHLALCNPVGESFRALWESPYFQDMTANIHFLIEQLGEEEAWRLLGQEEELGTDPLNGRIGGLRRIYESGISDMKPLIYRTIGTEEDRQNLKDEDFQEGVEVGKEMALKQVCACSRNLLADTKAPRPKKVKMPKELQTDEAKKLFEHCEALKWLHRDEVTGFYVWDLEPKQTSFAWFIKQVCDRIAGCWEYHGAEHTIKWHLFRDAFGLSQDDIRKTQQNAKKKPGDKCAATLYMGFKKFKPLYSNKRSVKI